MSTHHDTNDAYIHELASMLQGGRTYVPFEKAVADLPMELRGTVPKGLTYSIWQLVEHIRIAQWDMVEFSKNPEHISPNWPEEYWVKDAAPADEQEWEHSLSQIMHDRDTFLQMLRQNAHRLTEPFTHSREHTLLRETIQIVEHNAYHTGEIVVIRKLLGAWN
jgi:DinB superfamily